jgi:hypothetical protein
MSFDGGLDTLTPQTADAHVEPLKPSVAQEAKMEHVVLGFTGLKGSGKDTAAAFVMEHLERRGVVGHKLAFASPLKGMVRVLLEARGCPTPFDYTDGQRKEAATPYLMGKSARQVMQLLGTEWGRNLIAPDLWIDTWRRSAEMALAKRRVVVVTDVRFPNEVEAVCALGGRVYRVDRATESRDLHPSEAQVYDLAPVTPTRNDGSLAQVRTNVRVAVFGPLE